MRAAPKRFLALLAAALALSGCRGTDIKISSGTSPESGITLDLPSEVTTSEPVFESAAEEDTPPESKPAEPEAAPEPVEEFSLPEEFYLEMSGLIERYGLNPGCDGTESCSCRPEYEEIDAEGNVTRPRDRIAAIYYRDLLSGYEYVLNPGAHFPVASTVKIPFCTLIYRKLSAGALDPEQTLTYEKRHYFGGTGDIVKGDFGQQFSISELLTLAITVSDNVAYEMLKDIQPWDEFSGFLSENGCPHEEDSRLSKQKICAESAGAYARILAGYLINTDDEFSETFRQDLLKTRLKMLKSNWNIYRKYGWTGFSLHDIAYVEAPRPYVLAVLTNFSGEQDGDFEFFAEVSSIVEKFSQPQISDE